MAKRKTTDYSQTLAAAGTVVTALLLVGVVVMAMVSRRSLTARASRERAAPVQVAINWPAITDASGKTRSWMSEPIQRSIERVALGNLTSDPMDAKALQLTSEALFATGWFTETPRVIRAGREGDHAIVKILGQWRSPVAVVRRGETDQLISASAEVLPLTYSKGQSGLRFIAGPFSPPPEKPGEAWLGGDVQAGLALLAMLQPTPVYAQVAGVDIGQYVTDKRLIIVTDTGGRIIWGAAPSDWAPSEPTASAKLQRMVALQQKVEFGKRIDAGESLIDLTSPRGIMMDKVPATNDPNGQAFSTKPAKPQSSSDQAAGGGVTRRVSGRTSH